MYLPLGKATALNFMAPLGAAILTAQVTQVSLKSKEMIGISLAIIGALIVAQPFVLKNILSTGAELHNNDTLIGIAFAMVGAVGGIVRNSLSLSLGNKNLF